MYNFLVLRQQECWAAARVSEDLVSYMTVSLLVLWSETNDFIGGCQVSPLPHKDT